MTSTPIAGRQVSARRRPGARDKRKQVLDAAVQLFLANGFDQTSMDAIAAQAGVSKTTVYAHYSDKLALFRAVVERSGRALAVQMDESRLRGEQDPQVRLAEIVLIVLEATTSPEFQAFLRVMVTESGRHPDLAFAGESAGLVDVIGLIASTLEDEAERHGYELADARMFATVLLRMVASGPQLDSLLFPEFRPEHTLLDSYARWITAIFLRGIQPRTGDAREVVPPAGSYGYPWLPETGGRR